MSPAAVDIVIFDCDGVLVDSEPVINRAHAETLRQHGCAVTAEIRAERFTGVSDWHPAWIARGRWVVPAETVVTVTSVQFTDNRQPMLDGRGVPFVRDQPMRRPTPLRLISNAFKRACSMAKDRPAEWRASMALVLHGFRYSVYVRVARIALAEKGLTYEHFEVDPFAPDMPIEYLDLHPFKRVPTLVDGDFVLYETEAITRYIDEAFPGPTLQPKEPRHRARMAQIIAVIDSYGYVSMVRQVAGERVFAPLRRRQPDEALIRTGLEASHRVLNALETIVSDDGRPAAGGDIWSLADFHVAPMMVYFTIAPEGAEALARYPKLSAWWHVMRDRPSVLSVASGLPTERPG
ncbi:MAG TPA: glutathione S-transferase N-terminal domain-containing protein [Nitrolancea sp.]|nr:glutathione S-transferase N-terminal domain-containing protein [Lacipirellulaceae bacterium]HVX29994.1 glutathione S-transferase N-terminal domain-containing protein [Nitrolancea sp.]